MAAESSVEKCDESTKIKFQADIPVNNKSMSTCKITNRRIRLVLAVYLSGNYFDRGWKVRYAG